MRQRRRNFGHPRTDGGACSVPAAELAILMEAPYRPGTARIATLTTWHRRSGVPGSPERPARGSAATRSGVPGNWPSGGRTDRTTSRC